MDHKTSSGPPYSMGEFDTDNTCTSLHKRQTLLYGWAGTWIMIESHREINNHVSYFPCKILNVKPAQDTTATTVHIKLTHQLTDDVGDVTLTRKWVKLNKIESRILYFIMKRSITRVCQDTKLSINGPIYCDHGFFRTKSFSCLTLNNLLWPQSLTSNITLPPYSHSLTLAGIASPSTSRKI